MITLKKNFIGKYANHETIMKHVIVMEILFMENLIVFLNETKDKIDQMKFFLLSKLSKIFRFLKKYILKTENIK